MGPSPPDHLPANVLIVDDDLRGLDALSAGLSERGIRVRCARGVSEAAAKLKHLPCEVALVSLKLPGRGGAEMMQHIRRVHPGIVVVVLAWPEEETIALRSVAEGAFACLIRPFEPSEAVACIEAARRYRESVPRRDTPPAPDATPLPKPEVEAVPLLARSKH